MQVDQSLLDLHRLLVTTPSVSKDEAALVAALGDWCVRRGLSPRVIGRNLVLEAGRGGRALLFNTHLDTVPVCDGWTRAPLAWTRDGDRLYGLGTNDAKGCVAAMLATFAALQPELDRAQRGRLVLALTCDEETGGQGLESILAELPTFEAAVVGEPTSLDLCVAQKGLLVLRVTSTGTACHVAHADRLQPANAITVAARAVLALQDVALAREHAELGRVSMHVTMIEGGKRHNVIPDRCEWTIDLRTTPAYTHDELVEIVRARIASEVSVKSDRFRPIETPRDSEIVRACARVRPQSRLIGSATLSDAAHLGHVPVVKVGPGDTERSHRADEYLLVSELVEGRTFYENTARAYLALS